MDCGVTKGKLPSLGAGLPPPNWFRPGAAGHNRWEAITCGRVAASRHLPAILAHAGSALKLRAPHESREPVGFVSRSGGQPGRGAVALDTLTQRNVRRVFLLHPDHVVAGVDMVRFARHAR